MAKKGITLDHIIKTVVLSAFTIATALIWKEVITETIQLFVSPGGELFYKYLIAIISTILVITAVYLILKTENEAENILNKLMKKKTIKAEIKKIKKEEKEKQKKENEKIKKP